jgi:signal transduction histidine kinase
VTIRRNLGWLTVTGLAGGGIFAAVAFAALFRIEINGPIYQRIALSKDIVSDYVPPSESLLPEALICVQMNLANDPAQREKYRSDFAAAREDLEKTYADYMRRMPEGPLKERMRGVAHQTAEEYFRIVDEAFIPLVEAGDHAGARDVFITRMKPLYERHAQAVQDIVTIAQNEARDGESLATRLVRYNTVLMIAVGLLALLACGALWYLISRAINRQTDRLVESERAQRVLNRTLVALSACNAAMVKATNEKALLDEVCSILTRQADYTIACVGYVQHDAAKTVRLVGVGGAAEDLFIAARVGWGDDEYGQGIAGRAIRSGRAVSVRELDSDLPQVWTTEFAKYGVKSRLAVPLKRQGEVFGIVAFFSREPDRFDELEIERATEFGNNLAIGIIALRMREERTATLAALERAKNEVEQQVRVRTAELRVAKEAAESADHTKSAFLAAMSHELRTPLNSIIGFTDIALRELAGPLNAEQKKQLGMVQGSSLHLLALINDVLDISKIEAGQLTLHVEPFDARQSLEKVVGTMLPQARAKGLSLQLEVTDTVAMMRGDARRFEQVLLNLLSNAIKFTVRGGVSVHANAAAGQLAVSVQDTGIGISPGDLGKLFQPFRQLDSSLARQHEGSGLGLSIAKRLVEIMRGRIAVSSEPGRGSTFTVQIPINLEAAS